MLESAKEFQAKVLEAQKDLVKKVVDVVQPLLRR